MISRIALLGLSVAVTATTGAALAEDTRANTATRDEAGSGLEEVVVTANRRPENRQLVPTTIATLDAEELSKQGVATVGELPRIVPGLFIQRSGAASNLYMRGVGTNTAGFNAEAPVAIYLDGLYIPNPGSSPFSFNNIERLEILKGPQGTLYGRNSTGGLINIITRDPSLQAPEIDASLSLANYETVSSNIYASVPMGENLAASVAFTRTEQNEGWGRNTVDGSDLFTNEETAVQGKIRWTPTESTVVQLQGMYADVETDQGNVNSVYPGSIGMDGNTFLGRYIAGDRRTPFVTSEFRNVALKIEQDVGFADLMSLTGYIEAEALSLLNRFGIPGELGGQGTVWSNIFGRSRTFSQELQLSSKETSESPFSWITGLYYLHDKTMTRFDTLSPCLGATADTCMSLPGNGAPTRNTAYPVTRSYAVYGEGTYEFTPTTRLTLGARYTSDRKSLSGLNSYLQGLPNSITEGPPALPQPIRPGLPAGARPAIPTSRTYEEPSFKVVLAQDLADDVHAYVSFNRGFRSGTYNVTSFSNPPIEPEILDAYELGVKSTLFDRMLRLNGALFYMDYKDIQLRTSAPPAPVGSVIVYNAASARIRGVDLDFEFAPTAQLMLTGSAEYLDARFGRLLSQCSVPPGPGVGGGGNRTVLPCDNSDHRMPYAPRWSYTLGATYTIESDIGSFAFGVSDAYKGEMTWDPAGRLAQDAYHLINSDLTWTSPERNFQVQLFVRNWTDEYYLVAGSETSADLHVPGAPRTYGIKLGYRY